MSEQLPETKHCPFCGYNDVTVAIEADEFGRHSTATCQICGCEVGGIGVIVGDVSDDELKASAIQAWNNRSEPRND